MPPASSPTRYTGDQVARDDEEDVDAGESTHGPGGVDVESHDAQDSDRAEAVDVRSVSRLHGSLACGDHRNRPIGGSRHGARVAARGDAMAIRRGCGR